MGLIRKIKRALGLGSDPPDRGAEGTTVTVEQGPDADDGEPTADEGADATTGTASTTPEAVDEADAEPGIGADDDGVESADDVESESTEDTKSESSGDASEGVGDSEDGEPVERIKGIGPAYGERLGDVGIETVADLAAADPAAVAEEASVGETRATTWIDRAKKF